MSTPREHTHALLEQGKLIDIIVFRGSRRLAALGSAGVARELSILPPPEALERRNSVSAGGCGAQEQTVLPVLIGSGTGAALEALTARLEKAYGPDFFLAVIDKEEDILAVNGLQERFAAYPGIHWLGASEAASASSELTKLQSAYGNRPLFPILNPFYLRLDREYYHFLHQLCDASNRVDFWGKARYAKFTEKTPRILLLTSKYFLMGEVLTACERLGIPHRLMQVPQENIGKDEFVEQLLSAVLEFKPDFVFTINHLGIDREGILTDLLEKLRLPLASWFVDNPHLVLSLYTRLVCPWISLFTWDADNIDSLRELGFEHVDYLPLGVDVQRFAPPVGSRSRFADLPKAWDKRVSFVGNSMVYKVYSRQEQAALPPALASSYREVAAGFSASDERSVRNYLQKEHPQLMPAFDSLEDINRQLGYETMLTWEATRQYRRSCIDGILPFSPLIAGDKGWRKLFDKNVRWHYYHELNYYDDLPHFYPCADINFNCTSKQMKGAVNQRVFDVPATGAFLLTDYREQVENLFETGREIICYHSPEEATALAEEYLARPADRAAVAAAARKRILAEHSYEYRLQRLIQAMQQRYA